MSRSLRLLLLSIVAGGALSGLQAEVMASGSSSTALDDVGLGSRWTSLVRSHRFGIRDQPLIDLAHWDTGQLAAVLEAFRKQGATALHSASPDELNQVLIRGALVHADIARLAPVLARQFTGLPGWPTEDALAADDGRALRVVLLTGHWRYARALLDLTTPGSRVRAAVRSWYRAVGATLLAGHNYVAAISHLEAARKRFPEDEDFLLLTGLLHETLANLAGQALLRQADAKLPPARQELKHAERVYERIVRVAPAKTEAQLHLGRVRFQLGDDDDARDALRVATGSPAPGVRYCAELFSGALEEKFGRVDEARAHYRAAAGLQPSAQAPHLALSHLARESGDRREAVRQIEALHTRSSRLGGRADPWWTYFEAPVADYQQLLDAVERSVDSATGWQ